MHFFQKISFVTNRLHDFNVTQIRHKIFHMCYENLTAEFFVFTKRYYFSILRKGVGASLRTSRFTTSAFDAKGPSRTRGKEEREEEEGALSPKDNISHDARAGE